jgi:hypothetical protein
MAEPLRITIAFTLLFAVVASADKGPSLKCRPVVPKEYRQTRSNPPPNGQSESGRYTVAYEAYWWNCVAVRAIELDERCPFMASGTPAATAGARDGVMNANDQIDGSLRKYSARAVQEYLCSIASRPEAKEKMRHYFDKPTSSGADQGADCCRTLTTSFRPANR